MFASLNTGLGLAFRCGHSTIRNLHSSSALLKDYYRTLGIAKNASQKDVKKAYYQLAKKYHPDTNKSEPTAAKQFQEVSEAYEVLSDEGKRAEYDRYGSAGNQDPFSQAGQQRGGFRQQGGSQWNYQSNVDPEELFRTIFGEFSRGFGQTRGSRGGFSNPFDDVFNFDFQGGQQSQCNITFMQAAKGVTKEIEVVQMSGNLRSPTLTKRKLTVPIPAGIADGQTLRLTLGNQEVFVTVRVEDSDYFTREGYDVHTSANISISQAILGGIIRIQGLYEDLNIRIPAGTDSHSEFTLSGRGLKHMEAYNTYGDHIVHMRIKLPVKLTAEQREILEDYARLEKDTPGTINGVDQSVWSGLRRNKKPDPEKEPRPEQKTAQKPDSDRNRPDEPTTEKEEENPGILTRIKRAVFG